MPEIEWPPGSGLRASYDPFEMKLVRAVVAAAEREGGRPDEILTEVAFLHELKATFDGTFLS